MGKIGLPMLCRRPPQQELQPKAQARSFKLRKKAEIDSKAIEPCIAVIEEPRHGIIFHIEIVNRYEQLSTKTSKTITNHFNLIQNDSGQLQVNIAHAKRGRVLFGF